MAEKKEDRSFSFEHADMLLEEGIDETPEEKTDVDPRGSDESFPVAGIGASAGGRRAVKFRP
jgi:hypothetical protein